MSTWNYQVFYKKYNKHKEGEPHYAEDNIVFGIYEYYGNISGEEMRTDEPVRMVADSIEGLEWKLKMMLKDLKKYKARDADSIGKEE